MIESTSIVMNRWPELLKQHEAESYVGGPSILRWIQSEER